MEATDFNSTPARIGETTNQFLCGNAVAVLQSLPESFVDTVVTSPPYFQQRDYGSREQIGQEPTPQQYVSRLVEVFSECRRVLKPSGSLWLVLGDKYQSGELMGMPWRVAIGLQDAGWKLRNEIIWHKPNAMPSSARKRLTVDHESIFFFSADGDYYYDADSIREPHVTFSEQTKMKGGRKHFGKRGGTPEQGKNSGSQNLHDGRWDQAFHPKGRNKRTVWSIPLSKCREAHFAVFPESLVETCVQASCPEGGIVLDPFSGTGTTARVAHRLNRKFVAIDCSEKYCAMARELFERSG